MPLKSITKTIVGLFLIKRRIEVVGNNRVWVSDEYFDMLKRYWYSPTKDEFVIPIGDNYMIEVIGPTRMNVPGIFYGCNSQTDGSDQMCTKTMDPMYKL